MKLIMVGHSSTWVAAVPAQEVKEVELDGVGSKFSEKGEGVRS